MVRKYLGVHKKWAIIFVIFVVLAIIGVVVGVVVSRTRAKSVLGVPATTTQPTTTSSTSSAPVTSGTTGLAQIDCPGVDATRIDTPSSWTVANRTTSITYYGRTSFQIHCYKNWPANSDAANGNGTVHNYDGIWGSLIAYTLNQCLQYCADYNNQSANVDPNSSGSNCVGVTYNANLSDAIPRLGNSNCFLKDRMGTWNSAKSWTAGAVLLDRTT